MSTTAEHLDAESVDPFDRFPPVGIERALASCRHRAADFARDYGAMYSLDAGQLLSVAAARLEWLLEDGRRRIGGLFSEAEFVLLVNVFKGDLLAIADLDQMAGCLCDDLGLEPEEVDASPMADLVQRLCGLDAVQRLALADGLEHAFYGFPMADRPGRVPSARPEGSRFRRTLEALGIEMA